MPLMASQQSSLSGMRTALICQAAIARMAESVSVGPSQMPQPSAQAYSAPERFTGQPDDSSVLINQLILTNRQGKGHAGCLFSAVHGGRRRACHNAGEHDSHHEKGQTKGGAGVRCSYVAVVHLWL